jgi:hypothetical protein
MAIQNIEENERDVRLLTANLKALNQSLLLLAATCNLGSPFAGIPRMPDTPQR